MASLLSAKVHLDERGCLSVLDGQDLPFSVKRVFFIHSIPKNATRGGHSHKKTRLALMCLRGSCNILVKNALATETFTLNRAHDCLLVDVGEWHELTDFSEGALLLALASEAYDPTDYVSCPA